MFAGVNLTGATGTLAVSSLVELKVGLRKEVSTWSEMLGKNAMLGKVMRWILFIVTFHHSIFLGICQGHLELRNEKLRLIYF